MAACRALARVASALFVRHGRIWGSRETIAALALDLACNAYGSEVVGRLVEPCSRKQWRRAVRPAAPGTTRGHEYQGRLGVRQEHAAPRQRKLAGDIGVEWSEFAIISPDIWRKQLLDYSTLGPAYKYGGPFTGEELQIVDRKLDATWPARPSAGK